MLGFRKIPPEPYTDSPVSSAKWPSEHGSDQNDNMEERCMRTFQWPANNLAGTDLEITIPIYMAPTFKQLDNINIEYRAIINKRVNTQAEADERSQKLILLREKHIRVFNLIKHDLLNDYVPKYVPQTIFDWYNSLWCPAAFDPTRNIPL